jgi:hypothetical protein
MSSPDHERVRLTASSYTSSSDGFELIVSAGVDDLNTIKSNIPTIAVDRNNTYLTLRASTIEDVFENNVLAITNGKAIQAADVFPDVTPPSLVNFTLDIDAGELKLTFSEAVDGNTLQVESIQIQDNETTSNISEIFRFSNETETTEISLTEILVIFTDDDLNLFKKLVGLVMGQSDIFLSIEPGSIKDFSNNSINDTMPLKSESELTPDMTAPELLAFSLDLMNNSLSLTFSETVNGSSLDVAQIRLQGEEIYRTGDFYYLNNSQSENVLSTIITVDLSIEDTAALKMFGVILRDNSSTFLALGSDAVFDTSGNPVTPIPNIAALPVLVYIVDERQPILEQFTANLSSDVLTLFFSETVDVSTLDLTEISLYNDSVGTLGLTLTGGITYSMDGPEIAIILSTADLNIIKAHEDFGTTEDNFFIAITSAAISDTDGNPVVPVEPNSTQRVNHLYNDETSPELVSLSFDANQGILTLSFSETVRVDTLNISSIILQNDTDMYVEYRLTGGSVVDPQNQAEVRIELVDEDFNDIKSLTTLATTDTTTLVRLDSSVIEDMSGNLVVMLNTSDAIRAIVYEKDTTPPELLGFQLDLNSSQLFLNFSETVDASSVNVTAIMFLSDQTLNATTVELQTSTASQYDSKYITIFLSPDDLNELNRHPNLATDPENTFISLDVTAVMDTDGNEVTAIPPSNATGTDVVVQDRIRPVLSRFSFDANLGFLHLTFDETVNGSSLIVEEITIQSELNITANYSMYTLTNGSMVVTIDNRTIYDPVITIALSLVDQNSIKSDTEIATFEEDTFLVLTDFAVMDMFENYVIAIQNTSALEIETGQYFQDITSPTLEMFTLDLDSGELLLYFSETVSAMSLAIDTVTIQSSPGDSNDTFTLTRGVVSGEDSPVLTIYLSAIDLNEIKLDRSLATDISNTAISITGRTVHDMAIIPNYVQPNSIWASEFTNDTTQPILEFWIVNVNTSEIVLFFSETVEIDSFDVTALTLQSVYNTSANISGIEAYTLQTSITVSEDDTEIVIMLLEDDLNILKQMLFC